MVSVAELVGHGSLALAGVHLPQPTAGIRWVATSELADPSPFLEGGEVLLTTGLEMRQWRSQWKSYVARLVARQVVALGFATGLTHRAVPAGLIAACRTQGLNVFEVPRATTFVAISHTLASMKESESEHAARRSLEAQRQLTQAALRQDDPAALVTRLADIVDGAAALVGPDGVEPRGPARTELDVSLVASEVDRLRPQGLRAATSVQTGAATLVVQPVGLTGPPVGHLAVYIPHPVTDRERTAIATAVSLLGLAAQTRLERRDADRRLRARALELLVEADARTATIVLEARGERGVALPKHVVIARATGPDHALSDALEAVENAVPLAALVREELWLAVTPGAIDHHLAKVAERGLLVGVGGPETIDDARRSWTNAGHALTSATSAAPVVRWERLVNEGALAVIDGERAAAFAASFLARLSDEELVRTLSSFLHHHGSRLKVADELGIHRNTVGNRIAQIETALGRSLDDPQVRVNAWIALQVASNSATTSSASACSTPRAARTG
ncbi:PucR family transcriptional regulator [Amycolatopsis marina]|nr:PucR family transcriptional regulator [Amycolatopsis marina]